jgi:alpha-glucosidase
MKQTFFTLSLVFCFFFCKAQHQAILYSPDHQLKSVIYIKDGHQLAYRLDYRKTAIIEPSALGFVVGGESFGTHVLAVCAAKRKTVTEHYALLGKHARAAGEANELDLRISENGREYHIIARLYNDGFAYRYAFPAGSLHHVDAELSSFKIPAGSRVWFAERNNDWKLKSYAGEWISADISQMNTISPMGPVQGKPIVARLKNSFYIAVTEAALYDYSGLRLRASGERTFTADFTEGVKGFTTVASFTPWRVVMVARDLNVLVNSDIITNLNPVPDPKLYADQSYIKPGRCVWSWMTRDTAYMKPYHEKQFIDHAAQLHFEYSLLDEGWEKLWPSEWRQLKDICAYGNTKGVGVWVWKRSAEIRDSAARDQFLDSVKASGAVGVKVDFMNSEAKELIDFDIDLLKACAKRRLMADLHGCQAPSGECRTYPNEMTREGIRGMELNGMPEGPITATHNAALPFTRFITGHGDYTPGLFSNPGNTTWGQQLACLFMFDSPVNCLAENPGLILSDPDLKIIVPFLQAMPVTWDQTVVLPGSSIGKLAVFAKRKNRVWYISVINGEAVKKSLIINFSFLPLHRDFTAETINDGPGKSKHLVNTPYSGINHFSNRSIDLEPNGGFVLRLAESSMAVPGQ